MSVSPAAAKERLARGLQQQQRCFPSWTEKSGRWKMFTLNVECTISLHEQHIYSYCLSTLWKLRCTLDSEVEQGGEKKLCVSCFFEPRHNFTLNNVGTPRNKVLSNRTI